MASQQLSAPSGSIKDIVFLPFLNLLRGQAIDFGMQQVLDFYRGLSMGLAGSLDELFLLARLCLVKRVAQFDTFERVFVGYFYGIDIPEVAEGDPHLLHTKAFREWLEHAVAKGELSRSALWTMSIEELMARFWETVRQQMEAHHGGNRWVGTGGTSPFGHSGQSRGGIRVYGQSKHGSALKVIGDRRYVNYTDTQTLSGSNIRQALASLKHLIPTGPEDLLDLDETIAQTCRNGGEIEPIFKREKLDRIKLVVLIDNGGSSMRPFAQLTRLLFDKIRDRFKDYRAYFFHNTIYGSVYADSRRTKQVSIESLLKLPADTRIFVVGDASMAPEELLAPFGSIRYGEEEARPSIEQWQRLKERFKYFVWLNPIPRELWRDSYGYRTIDTLSDVFHMQDLTLRGIKNAVAYLERIT